MTFSHKLNTILTKTIPKLIPVVTNGGIRFYCPTFTEQWRAETLFTKEPETIRWINTIPEGDTIWDIGANVGCYSMYAAKKGLEVIAFEPEPVRFSILEKNFKLNNLNAELYQIALMDRILFPYSYPADDLLEKYHFGQPDHIKIDTDGFEVPILQGATKTLKHVKSILVEVFRNTKERDEINRILVGAGFRRISEQQSEMIRNSEYKDGFNAIYKREEPELVYERPCLSCVELDIVCEVHNAHRPLNGGDGMRCE